MKFEDTILAYLDGSLDEHSRAELLHTLSVSPEKRALLEEHLRLRELMAFGHKPLNVPLATERALAEKIGILATALPKIGEEVSVIAGATGFMAGASRLFSTLFASVGVRTAVGTLLAGAAIWYFGSRTTTADQSVLAISKSATSNSASSQVASSGGSAFDRSSNGKASSEDSRNNSSLASSNLGSESSIAANSKSDGLTSTATKDHSRNSSSNRGTATNSITSQRSAATRLALATKNRATRHNAVNANAGLQDEETSTKDLSTGESSDADLDHASNREDANSANLTAVSLDNANASSVNDTKNNSSVATPAVATPAVATPAVAQANSSSVSEKGSIALIDRDIVGMHHASRHGSSERTALNQNEHAPIIYYSDDESRSAAGRLSLWVGYGLTNAFTPTLGVGSSSQSLIQGLPVLGFEYRLRPGIAVGIEAGRSTFSRIAPKVSALAVADQPNVYRVSYTSEVAQAGTFWSRATLAVGLFSAGFFHAGLEVGAGLAFSNRNAPTVEGAAVAGYDLTDRVSFTGKLQYGGAWLAPQSAADWQTLVPHGSQAVGILTDGATTSTIFTPAIDLLVGLRYAF